MGFGTSEWRIIERYGLTPDRSSRLCGAIPMEETRTRQKMLALTRQTPHRGRRTVSARSWGCDPARPGRL